jgi:toxin ParE1/3/4
VRLRYYDAALEEVLEITRYYRSIDAAVADSFVDTFLHATEQILRFPGSCAENNTGARAKALVRFPYSLLYEKVDDEVRIIAIAHQSRKPGYWRGRRFDG